MKSLAHMMSTVPPPAARPRILLVEDDASTRDALAHWLSYEYDVVAASDGLEGLQTAEGQAAFDLVLTDVWMPRLDGVSMVRAMKATESLRRVPVIFLTGQTSLSSVVAGIAAGARAYLPKPIDLDVLDRKLRSALRLPPAANV